MYEYHVYTVRYVQGGWDGFPSGLDQILRFVFGVHSAFAHDIFASGTGGPLQHRIWVKQYGLRVPSADRYTPHTHIHNADSDMESWNTKRGQMGTCITDGIRFYLRHSKAPYFYIYIIHIILYRARSARDRNLSNIERRKISLFK